MLVILEGIMGNFKSWNSNFRNELVKSDCLDVIKYQFDQKDKVAVIANKNLTMVLKKIVKDNILQMIEGSSAFETYKDLVYMAPDKSSIMRKILAEVLPVCTIYLEAYVMEHQDIHTRLMKADPQIPTEESTHHAHMTRLLNDLRSEQQINMTYIMSCREDRSKESEKDVFKVGLKLAQDLGNSSSILRAAAVSCINKAKSKNGDDKSPKHPYLYQKWAKCDINPNTTKAVGRDKRKQFFLATGAFRRKQGQDQGNSQKQANENSRLKFPLLPNRVRVVLSRLMTIQLLCFRP